MGKETILLIEDNPLLAGMYKTTFEGKGLNVLLAHDGEAGIELAKETPVNTIVLDLLMPGIDGLDVLKILKNDPATKETKVIILTSVTEPEFMEKAKNLGAADYLIKSELALSEIISRVLQH